jgi:hypothetical protein
MLLLVGVCYCVMGKLLFIPLGSTVIVLKFWFLRRDSRCFRNFIHGATVQPFNFVVPLVYIEFALRHGSRLSNCSVSSFRI